MNSEDIVNSEDIMDSENITESEDFIESEDTLDLDEDFISPPKNFSTHWTGFLHSKQLKNDKAQRYNAKCTYCAQIFEACKEAMTNHILNLCRKISAKSKILYSHTVNKKKSEEVTEVPTYKAVLVTDYFDKAILSLEKTNELYTLLLRALVYSNISFTFAENSFFILFLNEISDLTLSLDGWMDVSNNSIYTFLLHKFGNINEIINIEEFSSIQHTASNLLVAIINSLQNVFIDFSKIIAIVTDNLS
ncbi:12624_t:CDS:2, partial [Dentiscutata erythropus]